jgi:hypothetical protein
MKRLISKKQTGIGLIEVLITTVVVAVGLVAVASLQTDLLSGSGESKIRSEARALAERKIEELRNNINIGGYNAIAEDELEESDIAGTNATFTRNTKITDVASFFAGSGVRKNISVQVSWGGGGAEETVNVVTEMAWTDPGDSAYLANSAGGSGAAAVPSPRQNASEDVASEDVDANTPTPLPGTVTATLDEGALPSSISVTGDDGATYLLAPITTELPATHFYSTSFGEGIIAVFLCEDNGQCKYIQNHFGGVALRIAGTVYTTVNGRDLNDIKVAWTSSEVNACYNGLATGSTLKQKPYECVFAGNCIDTDPRANNCYSESAVTDDQIDDRNVGPGGEYGDVGLLGVEDQGGNREQVCFLEDTTDPGASVLLQASGSEVLNENYMYAVTKRFYAARKIKKNGSINEQTSEGINRSYTNHNFLIVDRGTGNSANEQCHEKAVEHNIVLAPREIVRTLDESTDNQVLPGATYAGAAGTATTYTGSVGDNATGLRLYIPETGGCYLNNNLNPHTSATAYACAVASNATNVEIKGGSNQHPASTPAAFGSCIKTTDSTACNWPGNF